MKKDYFRKEEHQNNFLPRLFELPKPNKINDISKDHLCRTRISNKQSLQLPPLRTKINSKSKDIKNDEKRRSRIRLILSSKLLFSRRVSDEIFSKDFKLCRNTINIIETIGLQRAHVIKLHKIFRSIDIDNYNSIFINEFFELLKDTRTSFTDKLFRFLGINIRKKTLQFHEFVVICAVYCVFTKEDILQFCYESYDNDNSGLLNINEFQGKPG